MVTVDITCVDCIKKIVYYFTNIEEKIQISYRCGLSHFLFKVSLIERKGGIDKIVHILHNFLDCCSVDDVYVVYESWITFDIFTQVLSLEVN